MADVKFEDQLPSENYTLGARDTVYRRVFARADRILAAGRSVLLDATFLDIANRTAAQALADKMGVRMQAIWLEAPLPVLIDRVREHAGDASDADESVVQHQFEGYQAPAGWHIVSAAGALQQTIAEARLALTSRET
ncbi:MAG: AAA family ATPase [Pseudomonadota bacterium]